MVNNVVSQQMVVVAVSVSGARVRYY
jgi:hypothetical protein